MHLTIQSNAKNARGTWPSANCLRAGTLGATFAEALKMGCQVQVQIIEKALSLVALELLRIPKSQTQIQRRVREPVICKLQDKLGSPSIHAMSMQISFAPHGK